MKNPKISVIIPAHNEEDVISISINSVLNQTFKDFEIIVINDGSTDKTREIVEKLMKKNKKIRMLNFDKGHSAAFGRNRGTEISKGEILFFLDADNSIDKNFLRKINDIYSKHPEVSAIIARINNTYTNVLSKGLALIAWEKPQVHQRGIVEKDPKINFYIIKKKEFLKLGMFKDKIKYFDDTDIAHKFYNAGYLAFIEPSLVLNSDQPNTFGGFYRQYRWAGQGIMSIEDKKMKNRLVAYTFLKLFYVLLPFLVMLLYPLLGLLLLVAFYLMTYLIALRTSKNWRYAFLIAVLIYLKNIFLAYNIVKVKIKGQD